MEVKNEIWLVGSGLMGMEYAKVLKALNYDFKIITRGINNANKLRDSLGCDVIVGGVEEFIKKNNYIPKFAINAVGIDALTEVTKLLLNVGVKNILLEKPGVAYANEVYILKDLANQKNAKILLAYNRRFYQSVIEANKIIKEDGGVTSFNFEFTEWSHTIEALKDSKTKEELQNWFLGNSTHVIDLAFYIGGLPKDICTFYNGQNKIDWHTTSCNYAGAGVSEKGALFAYHANWKAPGRFSVEMLTNKHRLILRPLEKLQVQNIGSVAVNMVENVDYSLDENFKPGLYLQTKAFLEGDIKNFCDINQQADNMDFYKKMSGYK